MWRKTSSERQELCHLISFQVTNSASPPNWPAHGCEQDSNHMGAQHSSRWNVFKNLWIPRMICPGAVNVGMEQAAAIGIVLIVHNEVPAEGDISTLASSSARPQ
jgi:hypothetical protein